jgi:hypothetical protein
MKDESGANGESQFAEAAYANIPRLTFDASGEATPGVLRCSAVCVLFSIFEYSTKYCISGIAPIVPFLSHPLSSLCQCQCLWRGCHLQYPHIQTIIFFLSSILGCTSFSCPQRSPVPLTKPWLTMR